MFRELETLLPPVSSSVTPNLCAMLGAAACSILPAEASLLAQAVVQKIIISQ